MHILVLSNESGDGKTLLPALEFLDHTIATGPLEPERLVGGGQPDVVIIDAATDLAAASHVCRAAAAAEHEQPILLVVDDGGLAALKSTWGFHDWVAPKASPAELETRLRLIAERVATGERRRGTSFGELMIDEHTYVVRLRGTPLDLTYREFELLKYLAGNPGRVFTRSHLLQEVWGYDYYGGTRTVDVHIRRLRAKLGAEYESLIGTVRGVGYKLDPTGAIPSEREPDEDSEDSEDGDGSGDGQ